MTFEELRDKYPIFIYDGYSYYFKDRELHICYRFQIGDTIRFRPQIVIDAGKHYAFQGRIHSLEGIVFHIGLIELVSYWKCTCSPSVLIKPYRLTDEQQTWWKKVYWYGLGEFFYKNKIDTDFAHFLNFTFEADAKEADSLKYPYIEESSKVIVPIGGGKDSVVTLEELRYQREIVPFIINPREATLKCARVGGFDKKEKLILMHREIAPELLELNKKGFLNGHTPFSAMLAFYSVLISVLTQIRDVALSNESSADEPTILGTFINHQYSKSKEFETDFRNYVRSNMGDCHHYYSYLRPWSELQIAEKFARYPAYFHVFKSCNVGSKEDKWCCNCSKCLFTYLILSPFLNDAQLIDIFGEDLLDKPELESVFDELTGLAAIKPFECVGTVSEVNMALQRIRDTHSDKYLLKHYIDARLQQLDDNLFEDYFNMSMT